MNNGLGIFRHALRRLVKPSQKRKLYTDSIYPYPNSYMNNEVYPSYILYRETFRFPPDHEHNTRVYRWGMRIFWTWFFWQLFHHPEVLTGHYSIPDPSKWTDAELGIPPDEAGPYDQWLEAQGIDKE